MTASRLVLAIRDTLLNPIREFSRANDYWVLVLCVAIFLESVAIIGFLSSSRGQAAYLAYTQAESDRLLANRPLSPRERQAIDKALSGWATTAWSRMVVGNLFATVVAVIILGLAAHAFLPKARDHVIVNTSGFRIIGQAELALAVGAVVSSLMNLAASRYGSPTTLVGVGRVLNVSEYPQAVLDNIDLFRIWWLYIIAAGIAAARGWKSALKIFWWFILTALVLVLAGTGLLMWLRRYGGLVHGG